MKGMKGDMAGASPRAGAGAGPAARRRARRAAPRGKAPRDRSSAGRDRGERRARRGPDDGRAPRRRHDGRGRAHRRRGRMAPPTCSRRSRKAPWPVERSPAATRSAPRRAAPPTPRRRPARCDRADRSRRAGALPTDGRRADARNRRGGRRQRRRRGRSRSRPTLMRASRAPSPPVHRRVRGRPRVRGRVPAPLRARGRAVAPPRHRRPRRPREPRARAVARSRARGDRLWRARGRLGGPRPLGRSRGTRPSRRERRPLRWHGTELTLRAPLEPHGPSCSFVVSHTPCLDIRRARKTRGPGPQAARARARPARDARARARAVASPAPPSAVRPHTFAPSLRITLGVWCSSTRSRRDVAVVVKVLQERVCFVFIAVVRPSSPWSRRTCCPCSRSCGPSACSSP